MMRRANIVLGGKLLAALFEQREWLSRRWWGASDLS